MSSPPDVVEPVPMQVEERYDELPKKKEKVTPEVKKEAKEQTKEEKEEERQALQNAKTVAEKANNPQDRKDAKKILGTKR